jgi:hypothetical protein
MKRGFFHYYDFAMMVTYLVVENTGNLGTFVENKIIHSGGERIDAGKLPFAGPGAIDGRCNAST